MRDKLFCELVRDELGVEISSRQIRKLRTKFRSYQGKMSEFNRTVYFSQELYREFLTHIKSNTQCQN